MKDEVLYVTGPMSGMPQHNFPAFRTAADLLSILDYIVVNPADLEPEKEHTETWNYFLRRDLRHMLDCTGAARLAGWWASRGALLELLVATILDFKVANVEDWMDCKVIRPKQGIWKGIHIFLLLSLLGATYLRIGRTYE